MTEPGEALLRLRQQFVLRCREDLAVLVQHRRERLLTPQDLYLAVHRLAGAGGTFGFPEVSDEAERVEAELLKGADGTGCQLDALIDALASATATSAGPKAERAQ